MPSIFKALASISVWVLFIVGCSWIIDTFIGWALAGFGTEDWQMSAAGEAIGITAIILSVVAINLRKNLE
ncbi:MAG TPA: hypothetical protein G4O12_09015 [Dehalococcoidia bacterium]|nr:hypothetical protein [Dehalococcoidia bacterium]